MNKNPRTFLGRRDEADGGGGGGGRTLNIGMACATEADGEGGGGGGGTLNNGIACATEAVLGVQEGREASWMHELNAGTSEARAGVWMMVGW